MKNFLILIFLFYFLVLFQTSFLVHFNIKGYVLNLILILVILINLLEKQGEKLGLSSVFIGGFFLDIFSENFFGFWILILLAIATFIKFVLRKHVRLPV